MFGLENTGYIYRARANNRRTGSVPPAKYCSLIQMEKYEVDEFFILDNDASEFAVDSVSKSTRTGRDNCALDPWLG